MSDAERDKAAINGAILLKRAMKKPETFELIDAQFVVESQTLCYVYTARNSLNDQKKAFYTVNNKVSAGTREPWQKYCAGKNGVNMKWIKGAL